jgi:hypothetical protein
MNNTLNSTTLDNAVTAEIAKIMGVGSAGIIVSTIIILLIKKFSRRIINYLCSKEEETQNGGGSEVPVESTENVVPKNSPKKKAQPANTINISEEK